MKTAENITDEEIRELLNAAREEVVNWNSATKYDSALDTDHVIYQTTVALGMRRARRGHSKAKARAKCAAILTTRQAKP